MLKTVSFSIPRGGRKGGVGVFVGFFCIGTSVVTAFLVLATDKQQHGMHWWKFKISKILNF